MNNFHFRNWSFGFAIDKKYFDDIKNVVLFLRLYNAAKAQRKLLEKQHKEKLFFKEDN